MSGQRERGPPVKAKRFFIGALLAAGLALAACAGLVAWTDPLLSAGIPEEGDTALFVNERYEAAGLIRRQDYRNLVMGTSLAANFRASWFTQGLGSGTLKVTFPDGRLSEFDTALDLACRTHGDPQRVYFGLDPNILIRADQSSELPDYLYNDNPLDDIQLYLNAESLALAVKSLLRGEEAKTTLDEAYTWDRTHYFSRETALAGYPRPEPTGQILPVDAFLDAARANVAVIRGWAAAHPDTQFIVWFPPYSVLYWDQMERLGRRSAVLSAVEFAWEELLKCGNIQVVSFLNAQTYTTNLDNYADHIHCSSAVTRWMAGELMAGRWRIWPDAYHSQMDELRQFVAQYDYDAIFA